MFAPMQIVFGQVLGQLSVGLGQVLVRFFAYLPQPKRLRSFA